MSTCNDVAQECVREDKDAEIARLRTELIELRALELNHEGACVRLKEQRDEAIARAQALEHQMSEDSAAANLHAGNLLARAERAETLLKASMETKQ